MAETLTAKLHWQGDAAFAAESGSGHQLLMDGPPDHGGQQDVQRISNCGIRRFLVGEILMRQQSPGQALKQIFSQDQIHNDNGAKHG